MIRRPSELIEDFGMAALDSYSQKPRNLALWHLLREFEDSMPPLKEGFEDRFLKCEVTGRPNLDRSMWLLMTTSKLFQKILVKFIEKN
jgi:hypothetical protein